MNVRGATGGLIAGEQKICYGISPRARGRSPRPFAGPRGRSLGRGLQKFIEESVRRRRAGAYGMVVERRAVLLGLVDCAGVVLTAAMVYLFVIGQVEPEVAYQVPRKA